jgi:hypothetical protein
MADTKKILISVEIKELGGKQVSEASSKAAKDLTKLTEAERQQIIAAEKLKITNAQVTASLKAEALAALQANDATGKLKATSGLNNAILLETSRLASDANYGFTGMANNLGQLVSLFQISAQNAGGFGKALKQLKSQLFGIGGIMIGVQLLISFLPRLEKQFKKISSAASVLASISKSVGQNAESLVGNFEIYTKILLDSTETTEQHQIALKKLKDEYPDFNASILLDKENTEAANIARQKYIETLRKQAISQAAISKSQEIYGKIVEIEFNKELDLNKAKQDTNKARFVQGTAVMANMKNAEAEDALNDRLLKNEIDRINKEADEAVDAENKKLDILFKLIDLTDEKKKTSKDKEIRQFKRGTLELEKLELKYREESIKRDTLTEQQKIDIKYDFAKEEAQILLNQFVLEQALRLRTFLARSKDDEARKRAIQQYNQSIIEAERDYNKLLIQIDSARNNKILESLDGQQMKALSIRQKTIKKVVALLKFSLDADQEYYDENEKRIKREIVMREFALRDFTLEQDDRAKKEIELFNLQEELRQNGLKSEIAAIKEKQRVNLEYVNFVQGASEIFKTIAGENEGLQKAALVLEKGAAIADIIIRTQASNAQIRAGYAATAAIRSAIDPTALARFSALAELQVQRNNIGAGLSIANILATTLTSGKNKSGGGTGGGGAVNVEAPDFNVVGASPESQLAQSVASQQGKPIKAFVVGKEVTTQQSFDINTRTNATITSTQI